MLAVVRVFSTADPELLSSHSRLLQTRFGLRTVTYCIPDQPFGIHDDASEARAVPKIVTVARQAEAEGAKAIFVSCAADPGVAECRKTVSIPVLGAGSSGAAVSLAVGCRIGVLNLNGPTPPRMARLLGDRLTAHISPENVANTTDLLTPAGRQAALAAAKKLAEQADVIVFACTGFTTIGLAPVLRSSIRIPIIDAVEAGGTVAKQVLYAN
ncbi:aspartate/glutamate racemase family protein [Acetonema longum]|uniref:Asp/Glu racemase n=1 Tax=Acetonema longum DSM 6540 TaxID=1009370 RepID=F7NFC1_9FIRM|nr:aspartate/glutamate racemase family protein [Acetonema longum]EGO65246.1 Asp/Glu racemase [Acetonema longum DSM 6540]